jgi:uncharacterized protein (TIGR03435 family)
VIRQPGFVRILVFISISLSTAPFAFGQGSEPAWKFEIADVHPTGRTDFAEASGGLMRGGRYLLRHATMLELIRMAYDVDAKQILGGPNWLELDRFDIRARVPAGTTSAGVNRSVKPMLQALLAERFGLASHRDTQPVPAWALTVGKQHLKEALLKQSDGTGESGCRSQEGDDLVSLTCRNVTMAEFVSALRRGDGGVWYYLTDNLVVDRTELPGAWDFDLKYSARWKTAVGGIKIVSLFDAIEKLGLKLDAAMVPTPVVVVDRVNRTPTPNSAAADKAFPPMPKEFEVAAVKPANPDYHGSEGFQLQPGGLVNVRSVTLKWLVATGWGVTEEMISNAPRFMDSDRWDIVAKAPEDAIAADGDDDFDALYAMVQSLVADRFHMGVHFEDRPMPALEMIAAKPKLKKADPNSRTGCREGLTTLVKVDPRSTNPTAARLVTCTNVSMAYLASHLRFLASGYVHNDVLDATGLEGGWDFTLSFSKVRQLQGKNVPAGPGDGDASDPNGALSVQDAMEKQLGLKLVTRKRPVRVLVIDHVEQKPSGN